MAKLDFNALSLWITAAATQHPHDLAAHVARRTHASHASVGKALKRLVELNWLTQDGSPRQPHFRPGMLRQVVQRYALAGLQEDIPWARDFAPFFVLPAHVHRMMQHAFCELLNNAIDHSEGTQVTVSLRQTPSHVQLLVSDDGRGLFDKISQEFMLDDPALAMLELSKGKLTSQPQRHCGRGLFFTSKLADVFDLHANEVAFQHREWDPRGWLPGRPLKSRGSSIYAAIALDTTRSLASVMNAYSEDGSGLGFDRTSIALGLVHSPKAGLESRAQARRVAARLDQFKRVEVNFDGVDEIGHSFADELFRVLAAQHAGVELVPINMSPAVRAMVGSVRSLA
ncbi:MAG TPA: DUF4325 domain-containing protein [Rhizobacter sp.]|nr:DUF4325 domain-containing protein [Rhizobacter sp.]